MFLNVNVLGIPVKRSRIITKRKKEKAQMEKPICWLWKMKNPKDLSSIILFIVHIEIHVKEEKQY